MSQETAWSEAAYGSHLPLLEHIVDHGEVFHALEFGMGHYSTTLLLISVPYLTSVETDQFWYGKILEANLHRVGLNWSPVWQDPDRLLHFAANWTRPIDLVFVDSLPNQHRGSVVECMLNGTSKFVIAHDWEQPEIYGYNHQMPHIGYCRSVYMHQATQVQTVIFAREDVMRAVPDEFEGHTTIQKPFLQR